MARFFTFIGGLAIISLGRTYQVAFRPELTESEALIEFWWIYLIAAFLILISLVLQEIQNESSSSR